MPIEQNTHSVTHALKQQLSGFLVAALFMGMLSPLQVWATDTPGGAPDLVAGSDSGSSDADNNTSVTTPTLTGSCTDPNTVNLYADAVLVGTTTCAGSAWSITSSALTDGTYSMTFTEDDGSTGESGASPALSVTIDTTAPATPASPDLSSGSDSGESPTDDVTNDNTPTFAGSCSDGEIVKIKDGDTAIDQMTCSSSAFSFTVPERSDGNHSMTLTVTDLAGNESAASDALSVTIDTTPPAVTAGGFVSNVIVLTYSEGIYPSAGGGGNAPGFSVNVNGSSHTSDGWDMAGYGGIANNIVRMGNYSGNGEGSAIKVSYTPGDVRDNAGNAAAGFSDYFVTSPVLTATDPADNSTGVNASADLTLTFSQPVAPVNGGTITIKKTSDNTTVETIGVTSGAVTGSGSTTITVDPSVTLESGTGYYVLISAGAFTDGVKTYPGIADSTTWNFTSADVAAPTIATLSPLDNATGVDESANLTITFTEAVAPIDGGTITIKKTSDDTTVETIGVTSGAVTGSGSTTITVDPSVTLSEESHYVLISASAFEDLAGNDFAEIIDSTTWNFTVGSASTTTGTPDLRAASDLGSSATDNITSDSTPTFDITCTAGATVQLREGSTTLATGTCSGEGTIALTSSSLSDATYDITAREDSGSGYGDDSSALSVTIDTAAPVATSTPDLLSADDSGTSNTDDSTSDTTPRFTVSCAGSNTVTLKANGVSVGTGTCSSSTVTITASSLSEATHAITATQTDTAGNESTASSSLSVMIDATAPTVSNITSSTTNGTLGSGSSVSIQVTFSSAAIVTGTPRLTLETGASDAVINYVSGSTTDILTFTYVVRSGDSSADLDYVATSSLALNGGTILDAAGNVAALTLPSPGTSGSLGANKTLVIDGVAPMLSTATANGNTIALTYDSTLDGASTPATTAFTVTANGTPISVSTVSISSATVTLTLASAVPLSSTVVVSYALTATRTQDAQGNDAAVLSGQAVTNDSAAPSLSSASLNGASLTLTYVEALDDTSTPATTDFVVTVGDSSVTVSSVSISGTTVTVTLAAAVTAGQTVVISYVVPGSNNIKDSVGNEAAALTNQSVTNTTANSSSSSSSEVSDTPSGGGRGSGRSGSTEHSGFTSASPHRSIAPDSASTNSSNLHTTPGPVSPLAPDSTPQREAFRSLPITTDEKSVSVGNAFYTDVPEQNWHTDSIYAITKMGLVHGDTNLEGTPLGLYRPNAETTVVEMSRMLLSLKSLTPVQVRPENWQRPWMRLARQYDLPFSHRPALAPLTRAEAVSMILGALGQFPADDSATQIFSDVPARHVYASSINQAAALGYIFGDANELRTFRPNDVLTRAEAAVLMARTMRAHGELYFD